MILKLLSYDDTIKMDTRDNRDLANQLGIPLKEIETETISFERTDASVHLFSSDKLSLVFFYDLCESPQSVVYICTSRKEAFKVFREQTLNGCSNEYGGEKEKVKVEKILEKYGLRDDLKVVFQIIEKLGGEADLDGITSFAISNGLDLGRGYPSVYMDRETDEEMQRDYLAWLAGILEERGYLKSPNGFSESWRIVKQIDF